MKFKFTIIPCFLSCLLIILLPVTASARKIKTGEIRQKLERLVKDLDNDKIKDTVYFDFENSVIVCKLSSRKFEAMQSQPIGTPNFVMGIYETTEGFSFENRWMRGAYRSDFQYEPETEKIRLVKMSEYESGNAIGDGSGESHINLINGYFIGDWYYFTMDKGELVKIPAIKTIMPFPDIYLEDFGEDSYYEYTEKSASLYYLHKTRIQRRNNYAPVPKDFFNPAGFKKALISEAVFTFKNWRSLYDSYLVSVEVPEKAGTLLVRPIEFNRQIDGFISLSNRHVQWGYYSFDAKHQLLYLRFDEDVSEPFWMQELVYKLEYLQIDPRKSKKDELFREALLLHECVGATWDMPVEEIFKCETFLLDIFGR